MGQYITVLRFPIWGKVFARIWRFATPLNNQTAIKKLRLPSGIVKLFRRSLSSNSVRVAINPISLGAMGIHYAQFNLGWMHEKGKGVAQDYLRDING